MHINLVKFNELVDQKYLRRVESPCGKLLLFCYAEKAEYERYWTPETRMARGLIVEKSTGLVVAKPFEKFFNLGQMDETHLLNLPNEPFTVQEKLDGSLGILFFYNDKWNVATKGSFTSDQAIKATEMLQKYDLSKIDKDYTILVEIIYPANKIVVSYTEEKLVLLSLISTDIFCSAYYEASADVSDGWAEIIKMPRPIEYYGYSFQKMIELQKTLPKDQEGFVVRFDNGLRCKIKADEYLRIHKMISCMSPLAFWEVMENGKVPVEYLQQLPEEFRPEFEAIVKTLEDQYKAVYFETLSETLKLPSRQNTPESKKEIGLWLKYNSGKHPQAMFHWVTENWPALEKYCMKQIKPSGNEFKEIK